MARTRRTKEEIEAGLTVEQKKNGVTLEDLQKPQPKKVAKKKVDTPTLTDPDPPKIITRTRLSKAEKEAGLTVEQKKKGMTLENMLQTAKSLDNPLNDVFQGKALTENEMIASTVLTERTQTGFDVKHGNNKLIDTLETAGVLKALESNDAPDEVRITGEAPVRVNIVQEIRVINTSSGKTKTVEQVIKEELGRCRWEWKFVKLGNDFNMNTLHELGLLGWRAIFIYNPNTFHNTTGKTVYICMQRPIRDDR